MNEKVKIYKWYLILSLIYSFLMILLSIFVFFSFTRTEGEGILVFLMLSGSIITYLILPWFIFNLIMFFVFIVKKIEKSAWWLPILYTIGYILCFLISVVIYYIGIVKGFAFRSPGGSIKIILYSSGIPLLIHSLISFVLSLRFILRKQ